MQIANKMHATGLRLVPRPVRVQVQAEGLREATTGRVVAMLLPRVWAVAASPTHDDGTVMNGPPELLSGSPHISGPPAGAAPAGAPAARAPQVEVAFYRKYTEAMLRRYMRLSTEAGRVPSLLGREMFRGNVTSCKVHSFEDVVIFCHDMETLLSRLDETDQKLVKRIALQQYTQGEAAGVLGLSVSNCVRMYGRALDRVTHMLLGAKMLEPLKSCQEVEIRKTAVSV